MQVAWFFKVLLVVWFFDKLTMGRSPWVDEAARKNLGALEGKLKHGCACDAEHVACHESGHCMAWDIEHGYKYLAPGLDIYGYVTLGGSEKARAGTCGGVGMFDSSCGEHHANVYLHMETLRNQEAFELQVVCGRSRYIHIARHFAGACMLELDAWFISQSDDLGAQCEGIEECSWWCMTAILVQMARPQNWSLEFLALWLVTVIAELFF